MYHYKDRKPIDTIISIRKLLLKNDIITKELWHDNLDNLHSVSVYIVNLGFIANGKGITETLALASAYAELMERLQNLSYFRLFSDIYRNDISCLDRSNETVLDFNRKVIKKDIEYWLSLSRIKLSDNDINSIIDILDANNRIKCQIFKGESGELILPAQLIDLLYGTNGMVAGNSKYEALVQGLSEVIERYVNVKIIFEEIIPTDVTKYVCEKYERIKRYKKSIENNGRFKIAIKDFSLGQELPAIGIIIYDTEKAGYFVKIGVHPIIEVAIERCFTELMQGRSLDDLDKIMTKLYYKNNRAAKRVNMRQIFRNGIGYYPLSVFRNKVDNSFKERVYNFESNKDMYLYLKNLIEHLGYKVYLRDTSYTSLHTYQIIVPGMSETFDLTDSSNIESFKELKRLGSLIKRIKSLSNEEYKWVLHTITKYNIDGKKTLDDLAFCDYLRVPNTYTNITIDFFKSLLSLRLGDFHSAHKYMEIENAKYKEVIDYYSCFENLLGLKKHSLSNSDIKEILSNVFSIDIIEQVFDDLEKNPFSHFPTLDCPNECENCSEVDNCYYEERFKFYNKLKKVFKIHRFS